MDLTLKVEALFTSGCNNGIQIFFFVTVWKINPHHAVYNRSSLVHSSVVLSRSSVVLSSSVANTSSYLIIG